jgi:hypothetical protein
MESESQPDYNYEPLPTVSSIRLLKYAQNGSKITCSLQTTDLAAAPAYSALSYTWGSGKPDDSLTPKLTRTVICGGRRLQITQNLHDLLCTLRLGPHWFLWVDAICIDRKI